MSSLISNAAILGFTCKAYSLSYYSDSTRPENALVNDDSSSFHAAHSSPNQWWQVSFSSLVTINSYIIRAASGSSYYPKSWLIQSSTDNTTWKNIETRAGQNTQNNKTPIVLPMQVNCKQFRITLIENGYSTTSECFMFTFFDCFGIKGKIKKSRNGYSCYISYLKYKLFLQVYISSFSHSFIL